MCCLGSQVSHRGGRNIQVRGERSCGDQVGLEVSAQAQSLKYVHAEAFSCNMPVFVGVFVYICVYMSSVHQVPRSKDTPVAVSASSAQTLVSNVIPPLKGTGCSRTGAMSLEHLVTAAKYGKAPRMMTASQRHTCQLEGTPTGHTLGNFFKKIFIYSWERQRERGRDTGRRRSRLHAGSPTWDSILISRIMHRAEGSTKPLSHPGCPPWAIWTLIVRN